MSVLFVEDDDIIHMVLVDAMTDAGFGVIEAVDAETALALAETMPCPDLVMSDIDLGAVWTALPLPRRYDVGGWRCRC